MSRRELEAELVRLRREVVYLRKHQEQLLEASSEGFWEWDLAGDDEHLSERCWEMLGYPEEVRAERPVSWQKLVHPRDLHALQRVFDEHDTSKGRQPYQLQLRCWHRSGHWVTVQRRGYITARASDGSPLRMRGTHSDCTELMETRSRAEILYASATVGIWDWLDVNEDKEYWTPRFYQLLGYEYREIEPNFANFRKLLHPDDWDRTFEMVANLFAGEGPFQLEYRLRHKTKGYRWFWGMGEATFDASGKPMRMVGSIQDIHDRKVAEEQLKTLAVRHELSLRASKIGVWDWDIKADHIVWDDRMYLLYGVSVEDFGTAYEAWLEGVHPDDRAASDAHVQEALNGHKDFDIEFRVLWPSGEVRYLHSIGMVLRSEEGEPIRMLGVNWDVTEQKKVEVEQKKRSEQLQSANLQLEQFVYFASHDLQAPLRHISSFIQLIQRRLGGKLDDTAQQWMGYVTDGSTRMRRLIEDLLSYSRIEKTELEVEAVSLEATVRSLENILKVSEHCSELTIEYRSLPTVWAQPSQLEQLMQNVLQNAARYAQPDVPAWVKVSAEETDTHWLIHMADNGRGIPEEFHEKVFLPFQRFSHDSKGSGVGLAICSRIAQRHGGRMWVRSREGEGATFTFSLKKDLSLANDATSSSKTGRDTTR